LKKLIFQYYSGDQALPGWADESIKRFKYYSKLHNADYIFTSKSTFSPECYYFEHLRLVYDDYFKVYDRILYADVDVIVDQFDENIFDQNINEIGMIPEYKAPGMNANPVFTLSNYHAKYKDLTEKFNLPIVKPKSVTSDYLMFNSGVILWTRAGLEKARSSFMDWKKWNNEVPGFFGLDQPFINGQVTKHLNYTELPLKWNCFPKFRFEPGHEPKDAAFIHYTGTKKKFIEEIHGSFNYEN
jgi:lipopolysaccharide biosynthesis glycosyltransferase